MQEYKLHCKHAPKLHLHHICLDSKAKKDAWPAPEQSQPFSGEPKVALRRNLRFPSKCCKEGRGETEV